MKRVQELWQEIQEAELEPTMESYISALMSLSTCDPTKNVFRLVARDIYREFLEEGFTARQALGQGAFGYSDKRQLMATFTGLLRLGEQELEQEPRGRNVLLQEVYHRGGQGLESQVGSVLNRQQLGELYRRQLEQELQPVVKVPSVAADKEKMGTFAMFKQHTTSLEEVWRSKLTRCFEERIESRKTRSRHKAVDMQQFLTCVPLPKLVDIVITEIRSILGNSSNYTEPSSWVLMNFGNQVMEAYYTQLKTETDTRFWQDLDDSFSGYLDWYSNPKDGAATHRWAPL